MSGKMSRFRLPSSRARSASVSGGRPCRSTKIANACACSAMLSTRVPSRSKMTPRAFTVPPRKGEGTAAAACARNRLVRERVHRDVERDLLRVLGQDAAPAVAGVLHRERAAEAVLAHDRDQVVPVEEALELDVAVAVRRADALQLVERPVD